jgi:putative membrane protein
MTVNIIVALLHHIAAFTLVSTLLAELVLVRQPLTVSSAKSLRFIDSIYGLSAMLIIVLGVLRVMYFEKGQDYYLHSHAFMLKMTAFIVVGLLSIYPTVVFLRWGKAVKQNQLPVFPDAQANTIQTILKLELAGVIFILAGAVLMAKGYSM